MSVLLNTAGPSTPLFAAAQFTPVPNTVYSVAVGDFNGDGKPDLAVASYNYGHDSGSGATSVLLNTTATGATTASFAAPVNLAVGASPDAVAVSDFNGDGIPDLAVANYGTQHYATSVSVLLNAPDVITRGTGVGTIINSDPEPSVQFNTTSETLDESAGTFSITVTLSAVSGDDTTIPFTLSGTAANGTDYSGVTASPLVVAAGQTTATISGALIDDPGSSQTLTFTLNPPTNATLATNSSNTLTITELPTLTNVAPNAATAGDPATMITLTGTNFVSGSTADFNGAAVSTTFVSATQLTAVIPASDLTTVGTDSITVVNPDGSATAGFGFTINNPAPTLTSVSPPALPVGSSATLVTLTGTNFISGSIVDFNGTPISSSFVSSTDLTATIPAADLTTAGTDSDITVFNPVPGERFVGSGDLHRQQPHRRR